MPTKGSRRGKKTGTTAKKLKRTGTSKKRSKPATKEAGRKRTASEEQFIKGILIRGEAVRQDEGDELPPGATHVIVEDEDEGLPAIERERFSLY